MYHSSPTGPSSFQTPTRPYFSSPMDTYASPSFSPATPTYPSYMQQRTSPYTTSASTSSALAHPQPHMQPVLAQLQPAQQPVLSHVNPIEYWPQEGAQGTTLTITCDVLEGPGGSRNRAIRVVFGAHPVPTKVTVLNTNPKGEQHCQLAATVPSLSLSGAGHQNSQTVPVYIQVLDDTHQIIDSILLGQFHYVNFNRNVPNRSFSPNPLKRAGDALEGSRPSPNLHRRMMSNDNVYLTMGESPMPWQNGFTQPAVSYPPTQPSLMRTTQLSPTLPAPNSYIAAGQKAKLELDGDLMTMACGWDQDEWRYRRRLVQFWRRQDGTVIHAAFRPVSQDNYVPNSIVISCIYREDKNACFVTSVDAIYLLEALVGVRFTVEEKNRIRRNLEGFRPITISKAKPGNEEFFKLIMGFPNPKPRNIEKDVKVFPWHIFGQALKKIIGKYSASYSVGSMAAPPPVPVPQSAPAYSYPLPLQPMAPGDGYDPSGGAGTNSSESVPQLGSNSSDSVPQLTSQSSADSTSFPGQQHTPSASGFAGSLPSGGGALGMMHPTGDSPTHMMRSVTSSNSGGMKMEQYVNLSPPSYGPPPLMGVPAGTGGSNSGGAGSNATTTGLWPAGVDPFPASQGGNNQMYEQHAHQLPHVHQTVSRHPSSNDLRVLYPGM